jgi:omega-hydroxy-beta-dihydromenaquinone-9 sulfotransferase
MDCSGSSVYRERLRAFTMEKNPIAIIGAGRTGSTTFHHMLSKHPDLAWLSGKTCNVFPEGLASNRLLMRGLDCPVVGTFLSRTLKAGECCGFGEYNCKSFSAPYNDLLTDDVTEKTKRPSEIQCQSF